MRFLKWCRRAAVTAFVVVAAPAMAQTNCAGFTDVTTGDAFCPNVEWLKNRQITLGCSSTTLYCPTANVTRASMAAFLNRLGRVLTPEDFNSSYTSTGREDLSTLPIRCMSQTIAAATYPRRATLNNKVNVWDPSADVEVRIDAMFSTTGGAPGSWISVTGSQTYQTLRVTPGSGIVDDVSMYPIGVWNLEPNQSYVFALRIARESGTGNPNVYCENRVSVVSRNGTSSPLDEHPRTGRAAQLPPQ